MALATRRFGSLLALSSADKKNFVNGGWILLASLFIAHGIYIIVTGRFFLEKVANEARPMLQRIGLAALYFLVGTAMIAILLRDGW